MDIKNLSQLKKSLVPGTMFRIVDHCRPEVIGQLRIITEANTTGFYSTVPSTKRRLPA